MARKIWDRILSLTEAAARTGLSESWMRRLLMAGRLEGKKIGKTWLVLAEDVDALAAGERKPGRPMKAAKPKPSMSRAYSRRDAPVNTRAR